MTSSRPPVIRAVIAKESVELFGPPAFPKLQTKVVTAGEVGDWARIGWKFVCFDPEDEKRVAKWLETNHL